MKSVLNVIHSTLDSRSQQELTDVLISSTENMASISKFQRTVTDKVEVLESQPFLLCRKLVAEVLVSLAFHSQIAKQ